MSRTYAEILAASRARFFEAAETGDARFLTRVAEEVAAFEVDRDLFLGPDVVLEFLNANPEALRWVMSATDEPVWVALKGTVKDRLVEDLNDAVSAHRLWRIGNVGDLISRMIDFSSHVALDVMPDAVPEYFDIDMGWVRNVGSGHCEQVQSVVHGALEIICAFWPISNGDFNPAVLDPPWRFEAPNLLADMELLRLVIADDPKPVYESLQKNSVTRQHSFGKGLAR